MEGQRTSFAELGNFGQQVALSLKWYIEQFPCLTTDRKVEMENIAAISAAAVYLSLDLRILAQCDSPNTFEGLQASEQNSLWESIDGSIDAIIPNFSYYFKPYLKWVFVKKEEQAWDLGSRPPVGRYAPGAARRAMRGNDTGRPGGNRKPSGQGSGGRSNGPQGNRRDQPRGDREGNRRGGEDRNSRRTPVKGNGHAEQERAALEAVRAAVDSLRSDSSLSEIKLNPSNSFFRRLQHKMAVSEGFYSYSTGEGTARAVVVTREKQEQEEG